MFPCNLPRISLLYKFWRKYFIREAGTVNTELLVRPLKLNTAMNLQDRQSIPLDAHSFFLVLMCPVVSGECAPGTNFSKKHTT